MAGFFSELGQNIYTVFNMIIAAFAGVRLADILDIAVVAYVIYKAIQLFRETRALVLIKGIIILFIVWVLAFWWDLVSIKWLLVKVFDYAIIAFAIIFQPELRNALEHVGRSRFEIFGREAETDRTAALGCLSEVCKAAQSMQEQKIGALIVFERTTPLGDIAGTGTVVDAAITSSLVGNIFFPKSPLHDGGMIIRNSRVYAAGCILPLTKRADLSQHLGTRHRAAVGMSENSDAVVVVVSEETGNISIAVNGELTGNYNGATLYAALVSYLIPDKDTENRGYLKNIKNRVTGIFKK